MKRKYIKKEYPNFILYIDKENPWRRKTFLVRYMKDGDKIKKLIFK